MADETRQSKLASAKKKLKEYQQKNTPLVNTGTKKKRKVKEESGQDSLSNDRHSPDNIKDLLKVLVSDLSHSNGVALPSLDRNQAHSDGEVGSTSSGPLADDSATSLTSNTASVINSESVALPLHNDPTLQGSAPGGDLNENSEENKPLSSTESLRQLSQQLNGLLSQSSSPYINGDSAIMPTNEKELETKQTQDLTDQLSKERKDFEQKFIKDQAAMREQLQVHIQTIGILVSDKSELQTALSHTQQAARQKSGEVEELSSRFQASRQRVAELERTLSSVSSQQKQHEKYSKDLEKERDSLKIEVYRLNKIYEEVKQESSELSEQLRLRLLENSTMKMNIDELNKKLEMADLMIQQFSSQSQSPDASQQLHMAMEEKIQLESQMSQLMESIEKLKAERDQYAMQIQEDGKIWKQRTEQLISQVKALSEEKENSLTQIQELEALVLELQNRPVTMLSQESAVQAAPQERGHTEEETNALGEQVRALQQEKDDIGVQLQTQIRDNEQLSRLCQEQEDRLLELERTVQRFNDENVDRQQILEDMQSDKATISRALAQNRELKEQLAELQNGFVKLTNENLELTNGLQSEQHVKKELVKKMSKLQEDLHEVKEQMEVKVAEAKTLHDQRDQYFTHLQQYTTAYQQLAIEREDLHKQYLIQTQLMDRLHHEEVQGKAQLEISQQELQQAKDNLARLSMENEELKEELGKRENVNLSTLPRDQGDGVESSTVSEGKQNSQIIIPEDFESREEMVAFLTSTLSQLQRERDEIALQLKEQKRQHQAAIQQAVHLRSEQQLHTMAVTDASGSTVPIEIHEALRTSMEKLQARFIEMMQANVELKERVEELEHRCIQLSGETDTIGEYIALYQNQRAIMKQRHFEKEEYISRLAKEKEEMKVKLSELQNLVMQVVTERNEWYNKFLQSQQNPDLIAGNVESSISAERRIELNATDGGEMADISLMDENEVPPQSDEERKPHHQEDATTQQIMQLLQEIQNPQAGPSSFLGENPCVPFFYRLDEKDEIKIMVI
ncbi:golgin subfamily A member 2 isoform X3 [Polypterus senegalus]|uniref:golgin subfamily A member 2 isoform X3 n=1 Tax=Polypterus senegalus TaxID=55291 RepID=UPI0019663532|nr:golgin subfamily A member 2 isoform X3 [Polypterus senegalus]